MGNFHKHMALCWNMLTFKHCYWDTIDRQ